MARNKQNKIKSVLNLKNVFDVEQENIKNVLRKYFNNNNPFTLEIGCGHGDYTTELGLLYPEGNFVGIDLKGARIYTAAGRALELNLKNAAFLWGKAEKMNEIFDENSVKEIFIPFPDPHIKRKHIQRRLIGDEFLKIYKSILIENGKIYLKTDDENYYGFAIETLKKNNCTIYFSSVNLYADENGGDLANVKTRYEDHYLKEGRTIKYVCFGF